jgi:Na+/melibiose symporter-like transporter
MLLDHRKPEQSMTVVEIVPIACWALALVFAAVAVARGPRPIARGFVVDRLLRYLFVFPVGIMGLWAFWGHVFFPAEAAASIGWATSPFQTEVGMANLGLGLAGLYAAFSTWQARLATNLVVAGFLMGAGVTHILSMMESGNFAPGNAGPIFFTDFATPIAIFALLWLARRNGESVE